jgi:MFS family permease
MMVMVMVLMMMMMMVMVSIDAGVMSGSISDMASDLSLSDNQVHTRMDQDRHEYMKEYMNRPLTLPYLPTPTLLVSHCLTDPLYARRHQQQHHHHHHHLMLILILMLMLNPHDHHLTYHQEAAAMAVLNVVAGVGALGAGAVGDGLGRKGALALAALLALIGR